MGDAADDLQHQHDMEDLMARRGGNDKYLRLTGLWGSKSNDMLFTGRAKTEQIEALLKQCEEALDADAPLVFSLWENDKKRSHKDPEFSIQSFVGDAEEKPRSSRSSRSSRDEEPRERGRDRKRDNDDNDEKDDNEEDAPEEQDAPEEEPEEKPRRRTSGKKEEPAPTKKKRADW